MTHEADVLLDAARAGEDLTIPEGWGQGRATFGGLVGATLLAHALGQTKAADADVRAMTVNFVGPVEPGAARVVTEVLRQGKNATQVESRLFQNDQDGNETVRAAALITLGRARESKAVIPPRASQREFAPVDALESQPFVRDRMPDFLQHLEIRIAQGVGPYRGGSDGDMGGYMRFKEAPRTMDLPRLVTLVDAWPPAPMQVLTEFAPGSSMTWTMDFAGPVAPMTPESFWRYEVTTDHAQDGYGATQARVYDESGNPVVFSRQLVAVFG